ncbi:MAG: alpha/beta hydrolase [Firmicutes bacterium]|nr:alpha/beta hydrolase [Bacillota bacterium]
MVHKWEITIPEISGDMVRRCYAYVPGDYDYYTERRYPVMYMFDGQNVFFDSDATYGKSWGMANYLDRHRVQMIVVAVECNYVGTGRLEEYAPFSFENETLGVIEGRGKQYMDWLVQEFKPYIDDSFRTLPGREHTYICGSSMGGLMALYGGCTYNRYFKYAAALSPSLWVDPVQAESMILTAKIRNDTCIYMDYGALEIYNHSDNVDALTMAAHCLISKRVNLTFRIVPGGKHCEASWERQIPVFMRCLEV